MLLFFLFWNVPDSWGAVGLRAVPLFTEGGAGAVVGVRDVSFSITKGGRRGDKTFQKMLGSIAICVNRQKLGRTIFPTTMRESFTSHPPPPAGALIPHPPVYINELIGWEGVDWNLQLTNDLLKSNVIYTFKHLQLIIVSFFLQEVHELLGSYDLKYCFVDKYKGTGRSNCSTMLDWARQFSKFGVCKLEEVGIRMDLLYYAPLKFNLTVNSVANKSKSGSPDLEHA